MFKRRNIRPVGAWAVAASLVWSASVLAGPVDYDREIRPILAENCYACHGPDGNVRKGELRLDRKEDAFRDRPGGAAVVPGDADSSELILRLTEADPELKMPPPKSGKTLTEAQVATLRRWVAEGANWQGHWAFTPPKRPTPPEVEGRSWVRNPIDAFLLAGMEAKGLKPSPEADRTTLIRRVTLDLTGLPPTIAEVDAFLADTRPDAYERLVDRLLASPHHGERMAQNWLDAARYADTNGYHIDNHRDIWKYRDWVIDAFNRNLPFDQFTIQQMAGDLLPGATVDQKIASGFHRNTMVNFEGGADAEEYLTKYIGDRVTTTATVFLGVTLACAECHDHKYDPFTQKDFYRFYAFFNGIAEKGLDGNKESPAPRMKVPSADQTARLAEIRSSIARLSEQLVAPSNEADLAQVAWEKERGESSKGWSVLGPLALNSTGGTTLTEQPDGSVLASGTNPDKDVYEIFAPAGLASIRAFRLEALTHESHVRKGTGRADNANFVLTGFEVESATAEKPDEWSSVPMARAEADYFQSDGDFQVAKAIDTDPASGWAVDGDRKVEDRRAIFEPKAPLVAGEGGRIRVRLRFESPFPRHAIGRFRLAVTDQAAVILPGPVASALAVSPPDRSEKQADELRTYFRTQVWDEGRRISGEIAALRKSETEVDGSIPVTMVMAEMPKPRETRVLMRGDFRSKGEKVEAGVPESLPPLPAGQPADRLGLARWLVDPGNPLVARVTVNRFWQQYFGTGIVKTVNDFGTQGEWPSHPELLDWLATEFIQSGWDVKALHRLIVTSAAYRQDSKVEASLVDLDPENRLIARGPRLRLDAESIRDNALAISGLLDERIGGPSVYPYQPPGLWEELAFGREFSSQAYTQSQGDDLYRRGIYTYWKRSLPYPSLFTFDAPNREVCTVERPRTNTPLQALVLMNDPVYVESARVLGQRVLKEVASDAEARMVHAFRLCLARSPTDRERSVLLELYRQQLAHFRANPQAAESLLKVGESPRDPGLDPAELAAWTAIGNVLLNLDETITKG
ncbi:PSD1 and planctomycete cytochrome C domain-containing protein [Tundrisphaera lichenicola]|uniref:PSD1 and planctomycete cytochrome C domain-containing protein n=1 Tax=Tundrisphaera lichenicola TaxID=2029860 RepID=UPI003EBCB6D6